MATTTLAALTLLTILLIATEMTNARQIRQASEVSTIRSLANLSPEELVYILQTRKGEPAKKPKQLTPCARAILGCCDKDVINENCSEALHCGAHFFDDNPCDNKFIIDALKNARIFYEQFETNHNTLASSKS